MADIAPELLEKIERQFFDEVSYGKEIGKLEVLIVDGVATYKEVEEYAVKVGEALAQAFRDNLSSDILPDGKMYFNIANRVIRGPMENLHEIVSEAAEQVQQALNEAAGIRIKPQSPELDTDRIDGIINRISSEDRFDDIAWILDEPVVNFSQHVVDETIRKNVEFHAKSGFEPKVTRTADSGACKWCRERTGTFEYWEVKGKGDDVWQRHDNCRCLIEYIPRKGKRETVYNYREYNSPEERTRIKQRKEPESKSHAIKRNDKTVWGGVPTIHKKEDINMLRRYTAQKGFVLDESFRSFDGDIDLVKDFVDEIDANINAAKHMRKKPVKISVSYSLEDDTYAKSENNNIIINGFAYRSREILKADYQRKVAEGWFTKGSTYLDIATHESAHVIVYMDQLKTAGIVESVFGRDFIKASSEISNRVSKYATENRDELIAESYVAMKNGSSEECVLKALMYCGILK